MRFERLIRRVLLRVLRTRSSHGIYTCSLGILRARYHVKVAPMQHSVDSLVVT